MRAFAPQRQSLRARGEGREPLRAGCEKRQPLRASGAQRQSLCACGQERKPLRARAPPRQSLRALEVSAPVAARLEERYAAAADALAALQRMAKRGENPVTTALADARAVDEWTHYPEGDARDVQGRARYYYHVHAPDERGAGEHGHFHIFLEPTSNAPDDAPTHVAGLAMDAQGRLLRLFATNAWVTGETLRGTSAIAPALASFDVDSAPERADLDRWVSAIVRFYAPDIAALLARRDAALQAMRRRDPDVDILEDRNVRLLAEAPVDFARDLSAIENALSP